MRDEIEADNNTLLRQAPMTAAEYMGAAVQEIDKTFGDGYAEAHPELVGAFIQTSAIDLGSAIIARAIQNGFEKLTVAFTVGIEELAGKMEAREDAT